MAPLLLIPIFFGHSYQRDKNLKNCHHLLLCYAPHLFELLTLLVVVVHFIFLNSCIVSNCWLLHLAHLFELLKLLVVAVHFIS